MKKIDILWFLLGIVYLTTRPLAYYIYGYCFVTGDDDLRLAVLDSYCLIGIAAAIVICCLFARAIYNAVKRKVECTWAVLTTAGLLPLVAVQFLLPHARVEDLIVYGLQNRMLRDYKIDTFKLFAADVDRIPAPDPSVGKLFWSKYLFDLESNLKGKYGFLRNAQSPSSITESHGVVTIWWGRVEWGVCIGVNGQSVDPAGIERKRIFLLVENDLVFIGT